MNKIFTVISVNKNKIAVLLLLVTAGFVFVNELEQLAGKTTTYLPIENIKIEGKFENLMQVKVQNTVKSVLHGGYFTVDIDVIRQAILELPWVEDVSIRRHWPAGLNIAVEEKHAIAYWGEDKLLSDNGELFSPDVISHEAVMPYLEGPENLHKAVWLFLKDANKKINKLDVVVKRLVLDRRRSWEMQLSNNVVVKLGRENTEKRLQRFVKVFNLENAPDMQEIESIDLRYPNGFAMRMKTKKINSRTNTLVKEV